MARTGGELEIRRGVERNRGELEKITGKKANWKEL